MTFRRVAMPVGMSVLLLAGCAQPLGPTVQVMPGQAHSFEAFQADQRVCSLAADAQTKPMVDRAAGMQLGSAVIGTALGAGLGAAIGGGRGAAIGAGLGAIGGTGAAADQGNAYAGPIQDAYNNTYAACMALHGNQIVQPAAPTVVIQQAPVLVHPAPYYVQPTPYVVLPPCARAAAMSAPTGHDVVNALLAVALVFAWQSRRAPSVTMLLLCALT